MRHPLLAVLVLPLSLPGRGPALAQCEPQRPASCSSVAQPPGSCAQERECPSGYECLGGECTDGACSVKADCPLDGECVFEGAAAEGSCVCRGCGPQACPLGCRHGFFFSGCICNDEHDCPPEDDVCFLGICS